MDAHEKVIDGRMVFYRISEDFNPARVCVFLHGWGQDSASFDKIYTRLDTHGISYLGLDMPWFGGTPRPTGTWGTREYADWVCAIVASFGITQPVLVGHSFGGKVATVVHLSAPEEYRRLVLIGAAGVRPYIPEWKEIAIKIGKYIFSLPYIDRYKESVAQYFGSRDYRDAGPLRDILVKVVNEHLNSEYPRVTAQTSLVWGGLDTETPPLDGEAMKRWIPWAQLKLIGGGSHFVHREYPDEVTMVIRRMFP